MAAPETPAKRVVLGRLRRPWGRRGELLLDLHTDWPEERFARGRELTLEWDDGRRLERRSAGYRRLQCGPLLAFEGAEDIGAAERLAGAWLVASAEGAPPLEPGEVRQADLVGLRVELPDGRQVGVVAGLEETAAADLLVVALDDGREALVPFAAAIAKTIDVAGGRIVLDPPPGLLDLREAEDAGDSGAAR